MSQPVLLDNVKHHDLRLISRHGADLGDNVNLALVVPTEFAEVQREYPILFRQSEGGTFQAFALLGLETDENLYLDETGWQARYIPAIQARGPFRIGLRENETGEAGEPMIMMDPDHPRLSRSEGEPLFRPHGGHAPALERILQTLRTLHIGNEASRHMFAAFEAAGLLAPVNIEIRFDETTQYKLPGFFSISREALAGLDGDALQKLNAAGFLGLAFHVVASMGNISRLIDMKNRRRTLAPA
ncbi:SapC family protein [Asticcacaulis taihuensis]|uniref:SapC family protein n=1 Tax=Asticcacaulis taihuensis TaxID=260084 RepID=UPI0026EA4504|nr:SapC family protein [Asticcacaulis taihuensis]